MQCAVALGPGNCGLASLGRNTELEPELSEKWSSPNPLRQRLPAPSHSKLSNSCNRESIVARSQEIFNDKLPPLSATGGLAEQPQQGSCCQWLLPILACLGAPVLALRHSHKIRCNAADVDAGQQRCSKPVSSTMQRSNQHCASATGQPASRVQIKMVSAAMVTKGCEDYKAEKTCSRPASEVAAAGSSKTCAVLTSQQVAANIAAKRAAKARQRVRQAAAIA